jgi:hypothetical protein
MSARTAEIYKELRANPSSHTFTVMALPGHDDTYLGVDSELKPCLFIRADERVLEPPLRTSHVSLQVGQEYSVATIGGPVTTGRFHALRCETADDRDVEAFLVLIDAFVSRHEEGRVDLAMLTSFFGSMSRLFSVEQSSDLQGERQGLWGELFMMSLVKGFAFWAPFWHSETTRKFDFSTFAKRVEVKTALGPVRIHHFAHPQIYPLEGEEIMIASLLLRKEDAGLSLRELIISARADLSGTEEFIKLERAVRQAGMELLNEPGPGFDATEAEKSLAWYRAADAPHFTMAEPPGVSQTHYRVDLSTASQVDAQEISNWLGAWAVPTLALPTNR